jgi:predicted dehydrogenase
MKKGRDYNIPHVLKVAPRDHNVAGEIKELVASINNGTPLLVPPKDAAGSVACCCAAIESSRTGMPVKIKYPNV